MTGTRATRPNVPTSALTKYEVACKALAERANRIRRLGKAVVADVVEIGRLLTECRERLPHGAWLPWLEREFGWSDQTARNFMRLAAMSAKSKTVLNLALPMRDLYRLAAPSTSESARQEVIGRAAGGDRLRHDDIADIIAQHGEGPVLRAAKQLRAEHAEVRRAERIERIAEIAKGNAPLPTGMRYPIILADVPWYFEPYGSDGDDQAPDYPTMTVEEICALNVLDIASDPALLFFWATSPHLEMAFQVITTWGFKYSTSMLWHKTGGAPGRGHFVRIDHELLLIARRGDFPSPSPSTRPSSVIQAPRREHSRKPDELYDAIEAMYPDLPKIELFARHKRPGWAAHGNQVTSPLAAAPPSAAVAQAVPPMPTSAVAQMVPTPTVTAPNTTGTEAPHPPAAVSPTTSIVEDAIPDDLSIPPFLRRSAAP